MHPLNSWHNTAPLIVRQVFVAQWYACFLLPQDHNGPTVHLATPYFKNDNTETSDEHHIHLAKFTGQEVKVLFILPFILKPLKPTNREVKTGRCSGRLLPVSFLFVAFTPPLWMFAAGCHGVGTLQDHGAGEGGGRPPAQTAGLPAEGRRCVSVPTTDQQPEGPGTVAGEKGLGKAFQHELHLACSCTIRRACKICHLIFGSLGSFMAWWKTGIVGVTSIYNPLM